MNSTTHNEWRGYEEFDGSVAELASESTPSWPAQPGSAHGAPNVIVIMLDDLGFSDLSPYGSEIDTPQLAELADEGYVLGNYQSTPVCSPARAAFLTGLNPHRAGFATVANYDPGFPGYVNEIADDVPTIAESFQARGYATFMIGKWHLTKEANMHDGANKGSWPVQRGFDRYYGCMDGFTTQFHPHRLVSDNSVLVIDDYPSDYFLADDLTSQALGMVKTLRANDADKPFFLYFAHQAVHAPIQAKAVDIEKYRGAYDQGWDVTRRKRLERQKQQGVVPADTVLGQLDDSGSAATMPWESLDEEKKRVFAQYMEAYAATVDNVDQNLRRLVDHLKQTGEYENTIIVVTSDNGGTSEGGVEGSQSYLSRFANHVSATAAWDRNFDRESELIGGPRSFMVHPRGWASVANTPFRRYKAHTFSGGVRVPLIVSWPAGLPRGEEDNGIRSQFAFVTDLGVTLLDLAEVPHLKARQGREAKETDGLSFAPILRSVDHPAVRETQYWENNGRRGLIRRNWKIVTSHDTGDTISDEQWELYDIERDPSETKNRAEEHPELLAELAELWNSEAWNNTVFPLNDDNSLYSQRPSSELTLERPVTILPGTATLERFRSSKLISLRSFTIEVEFDHRESDRGVLVSHGDQGAGYLLYVDEGLLCFAFNEYGRMHRVSHPLVHNRRTRVELAFVALPDVKWSLDILVDGERVMGFSSLLQLVGMAPFTGISVGIDRGGPVDWDLHERERSFAFTGALRFVRYVPGERAPYDPEVIIEIESATARIYE